MKYITGYAYPADGGCGITLFNEFEWEHEDDFGDNGATPLSQETLPKGAGFGIAAFINTSECREAYRVLKERFKITYQSPVRVNQNTGNEFFFCTYDTSRDKVK